MKRSEVNHVNIIAAATEGNADRTKRMGKLMELHCQVGHMGVDELLRLIKNGKLVGIDQHISRKELEAGRKEVLECDTCGIMKTKKQTFNNTRGLDHGTKPAEVLHCDMWQSTTSRLNGEPNEKQTTYYMVFRDPYTQHGWRAATTSKDRLTDLAVEMIKLSERQLDGKVKRIYSDGGSEVVNDAMKKFCKSVGIVHQLSPPRTPELDGIAENAVFNHKTATFTMMTYSGLPDQFTTYAADHAMYLWNRVHVSKVTGVTPYEYIRGKAPSMKYWGVFGCDTLVHIDKRLRKTGDPHAERGIYLGHNVNYNCANIYILRTKKVIQSRHIRFRLNKFNYAHAFKLGQHAVDRILDGYDVELEEMKDDNKEWDQDNEVELDDNDLDLKKSKVASKDDEEEVEVEDDTEYAVERIVGRRVNRKGEEEFRVKWKDWNGPPTWEPRSHVEETEALDVFEKEQAQAAEAAAKAALERKNDLLRRRQDMSQKKTSASAAKPVISGTANSLPASVPSSVSSSRLPVTNHQVQVANNVEVKDISHDDDDNEDDDDDDEVNERINMVLEEI
ncbi:MAG TPA: hypothetical protein VHD33_03265, partial [Legionellaceae bacterium]|nr:hypothetical protein [Legionellaceae bacterium]